MAEKTVDTVALSDQPAEEAIPTLLELYGAKIRALGLRLCGGPEEADDILQETFLSAFRAWDQFEGRAEPSTWLFTIASRACQRKRRRRAGEPRRLESLEELLPTGTDALPDPDSLDRDPAGTLERRELEEVLHAAISRLPMRFRLPLVLKDLAEFKISEIARILDVKEATVKTRIHRARLYLRRDLSKALPHRQAEPPSHPQRVCLDLLASKQEAIDRGVAFPMSDEDLCERCRAVFASLDVLLDTCAALSISEIPRDVRERLRREIADATG
jgi:RNA polymerase sigma-70 factor (ECF subfamily)